MSAWRERKRVSEVLGRRMMHVEMGEGAPVLFLHGNPTSSFLWRAVMAAMPDSGRLIAPDLIGMGDSDKLSDSGPDRYTFAEHAAHLDAWIAEVVPQGRITLVIHDWGGALGFRWARLNPERVRAIAYMETIVRPMAIDGMARGEPRALFQSSAFGCGRCVDPREAISFVERILPGSILRELTEAEMAEYRRPFAEPGEARRPTLTWPRQIPLDGQPPDVVAEAQANFDWLLGSDLPKLFVNAEPGAILIGPMRDSARQLPNQTEVTVAGSHFIQEDSGAEIGAAVKAWLADLP